MNYHQTAGSLVHAADFTIPMGLMKVEWSGSKMICLSSKSYVAVSRDKPENIKFSFKGVNKRGFVDPTDNFENVLKTQATTMSVNRGIRLRGNTLFTYEQNKKAFVYFYCKRKIANDGIHSRALDIVLTPKKRKRTRRDIDFRSNDII